MKSSPSYLSRYRLMGEGWTVDVVERREGPRLHDLFGFGDLLAIRGTETLVVQTTTTAHQANRIQKVLASPHIELVRGAGWRVEVHGWRLSARTHRHELTITDLTTEQKG